MIDVITSNNSTYHAHDSEENRTVFWASNFRDLATYKMPEDRLTDTLRRNLRRGERLMKGEGSGSGTEWFGVPTADAVMQAVEHGFPEGRDLTHQYLEQLTLPRLPSIRRRLQWGAEGDELSIHKVNMGNIDTAWQAARRTERKGIPNQLIVAVDVGANCNVRSDELFWRGAATLMVVEKLMQSGRAVRVLVGAASNGITRDDGARKQETTEIWTEVKPMRMRMAPEALMSSVGLAGFFRTYLFRAWCATSVKGLMCSGLGHNVTPTRAALPGLHNLPANRLVRVSSDIECLRTAQHFLNEFQEGVLG